MVLQKVSSFNILFILSIDVILTNIYIYIYIYSFNTEPAAKKAEDGVVKNLEILEYKIYTLLRCNLELIHTRFVSFRNKQSPKVAAVQSNMNIHSPATKVEKYVENKVFLSCHLCLNAQTQEQHTEPDVSYTIIAVPQKNHFFQ